MNANRILKWGTGWLLAAIGLAGAVMLMLWAGPEWREAVVQGFAALGALWYWAFRSRPRVTLRLLSINGLYLELVNTGNRTAKRVRVCCDPPVPWKSTLVQPPREYFGSDEYFGDMDTHQRHVVLIGSQSDHTFNVLSETTFQVSHESTWGFRRRKTTFQFSGLGLRSSLEEGTATPMAEATKAINGLKKKLDEVKRVIETAARPLQPPSPGDRSE